MSFSKKYPIPSRGIEESLLLTWEQGYSNVKVYYGGKVIDTIPNPGLIKKGYSRLIDDFGLLELSFNEKPMYINVSVDGERSPVSIESESKDLKSVAIYFWVLFILSVLGTAIESGQHGLENIFGVIILLINIIFTAIYLLSAIFTQKGHPWAYFLGTFSFLFTTIIYGISMIAIGNYLGIVILMVRGGILYGLFSNFKLARDFNKYNKERVESIDLLDV